MKGRPGKEDQRVANVILAERGEPPAEVAGRWLIIWDGECGFCRRSMEAALTRDRRGILVAAPYQQCAEWLPETITNLSTDQVHLRSPEGLYWGGGDAVIRIVALLGHPRTAGILDFAPVRSLVGWGYRWVAQHRALISRWF